MPVTIQERMAGVGAGTDRMEAVKTIGLRGGAR
jgi:hypothetical protein